MDQVFVQYWEQVDFGGFVFDYVDLYDLFVYCCCLVVLCYIVVGNDIDDYIDFVIFGVVQYFFDEILFGVVDCQVSVEVQVGFVLGFVGDCGKDFCCVEGFVQYGCGGVDVGGVIVDQQCFVGFEVIVLEQVDLDGYEGFWQCCCFFYVQVVGQVQGGVFVGYCELCVVVVGN